MKTAILLTLLPALFWGQGIYDTTKLKNGIYRTFDEMSSNTPSLTADYPLTSGFKHEFGLKGIGLTSNDLLFYNLDMSKIQSNQVGKVYGFCKNDTIYVGEGKFNKQFKWTKTIRIGWYLIYKDIIFNHSNEYGGSTYSIVTYILNTKCNVVEKFSKSLIKDLLQVDEPTLLEFKSERIKNEDILKLYLKKYCNIKSHIDTQLEKQRKGFTLSDNVDSLLYKTDKDSTIDDYLARINAYQRDSLINDLRLEHYKYSNGNTKNIGYSATLNNAYNKSYFFKIGSWFHYDKTGKLEAQIDYNLKGKIVKKISLK